MRGFFDMVLNVNVTLKSFDIKVIPDDVMCKFLGGKGIASCLLLQNNTPATTRGGSRVWGSLTVTRPEEPATTGRPSTNQGFPA